MIVNSFDYVLQNNGALEDYLYAIHQFAVASTFWEVESVSPASPDETNITELRIRLISNNNIKLRFTPEVALFSRDTIRFYFTDGSSADWGDIPGESWSPPMFLDGYVANSTMGTDRGFNSATLGAQDTTGNKGCTFVETEDMCSMFVYGKGAFASNWQFSFQAGNLIDWHIPGHKNWGAFGGNPCVLTSPATNATTRVSPAPQFLGNVVPTTDNNVSMGSFVNWNDTWIGIGFRAHTSPEFTYKLGDPLGTQVEALVPVSGYMIAPKATQTRGQFGGFTRYIRMVEDDESLDWLYDSSFSSTIAWRAQTWDDGSLSYLSKKIVWIWPQGTPTTIVGTALT